MMSRTSVGLMPGWMVLAAGVLFNVMILGLALVTIRLKDSKSEVLPFDKVEWHPLRNMSDTFRRRNTIRRVKKARQRVRSVRNPADEEF